ncbi:MAG TPA: winged helix-turn-helix domain-containing protein [Candidatus Acidoferrum sp.]|nr:winged helix-turn-helix domain-containing protein [Candidatus Acidoferrum sp.]
MDASSLFARVRLAWLSADSSNSASNNKAVCRNPIIPRGEPHGDSGPERGPLSSGRYISFGPFRIDQQRQELSRDGTRIKLQGKVYQALLALLERPGEIITREDLRMRLWPDDTHVNYDANVNTTVNKLRGALGDSSDDPVYIETIPKKGYCLLVRPEVSNGSQNAQSFEEETPEEGTEAASQVIAASKFPIRIVICIIGLILAGMLLGAGIMGLWIHHATSAH